MPGATHELSPLNPHTRRSKAPAGEKVYKPIGSCSSKIFQLYVQNIGLVFTYFYKYYCTVIEN